MQTANWNRATAITPDEMPAVITDYLAAHRARALDAAIAHYTADAVVSDEGHDYHGPGEIRTWLARSASEYTYTIELTAAARADDQHFDAVHHLEGNFPGGVADLHFRFTLRGTLISRLVIEPLVPVSQLALGHARDLMNSTGSARQAAWTVGPTGSTVLLAG
jgi:ketosteroid isomerase-like protein